MKILITSGIFPPDIGGPASYVPRMASYLSDLGHDVTVLCFSNVIEFDDVNKYPFGVIRISRLGNVIFRRLKFILRGLRISKKFDLIFANTVAMESFVLSTLRRTPIVHKIVGDYAWELTLRKGLFNGTLEEFKEAKHRFSIKFLKWFIYLPFRLAKHIIVPSMFTFHNVASWGVKKERISLIYNTVEAYKLAQAKNLNLIVTVGRLIPLKRIDGILRIMPFIPKATLHIIGDGPEKHSLQKLALELGIEDRVHFLGKLDKHKTVEEIGKAGLLILNSSGENFPHVILEAMQVHTFVISNDVGGCGEIVINMKTGILLSAETGINLLKAVEFYFDKKNKVAQMVINAKTQIVQKFSPKEMLKQTASLMEKISQGNNR